MRPEEEKVLAALGEDFTNAILAHAPTIQQALIEIANKNGLESEYLPYLYYVLFEQKPNWPRMSKQDTSAVYTMLKVMIDAIKVPRYMSALQIPSTLGSENAVNTTIQKFALWGRSRFASILLREYMKLLKKYSRAWAKASPATPKGKALSVLDYIFKDSLRSKLLYTHSNLMDLVFNKIIS